MHEDAEVRAEDGDAAESIPVKAGLLKARLHLGRDSPTVQARGDLVGVLRHQDGLREYEHCLHVQNRLRERASKLQGSLKELLGAS